MKPNRPNAGRTARLGRGDVREQGGGRRSRGGCHSRSRWWAGNAEAEFAGRHYDRPASQRAALRDAAQYYEGQEEAVGDREGCGSGRRRRAAAEDLEDHRTAQAQRRRDGARCGGAGRKTQERSKGDLTMSTLANILVVAEHDHGALKSATLSTVTAAVELSKMSGGEVQFPVGCHNTRRCADAGAP